MKGLLSLSLPVFGITLGTLMLLITDSSLVKVRLFMNGCKYKVPVKPQLLPENVILLNISVLFAEYCNAILAAPVILANTEAIFGAPPLSIRK